MVAETDENISLQNLNMNAMSAPSSPVKKGGRIGRRSPSRRVSYIEEAEEEDGDAQSADRDNDAYQEESEEEDNEYEEEDGPIEEKSPSKKRKKSSKSKSSSSKGTKKTKKSHLEEMEDMDMESESDEEVIDGKKAGGIISYIYVENFMNHRKLEVPLNDSLNFITGKNGSGKSAIATALMICLGSRARSTGRGSSLAGLIREGSNANAKVRVCLHNSGKDAYKQALYGDRIIVERIINKSGGSKLGLYHGRKNVLVSDKRYELDNILRSFDILTENPCCVLTQENSKKFIKGKEEDKYDFFMKATGLAPMYEEIVGVKESRDATGKSLEKSEAKIEALRIDAKAKKEEMKRLLSLDQIEETIRLCYAKAFWIDVHDAQKVIDALEQKRGEYRAHYDNTLKALEEAEIMAGKESRVEELADGVQKIKAEKSAVDDVVDEKRESEKTARKQLNKLQGNMKAIKSKLREYDDQMADCLRNIESIKNKAKGNAEAEQKAMYDRLEVLEEEEAGIDEGTKRCEAEIAELENLKDRANEEFRAYRQQLNQLTQVEANIQQQINSCKRDSSGGGLEGRLRALVPPHVGNGMVAAYNEIQRDPQLKGVVVGPIGTLLTLNAEHKSFKAAIHSILGPVDQAFINTSNDKRIADRCANILRRHKIRSEIISQPKAARYKLPSLNYDAIVTVKDTLNINLPDGPVKDQVFNVLTDRIGWHARILTREENGWRAFVESANGKEFYRDSNHRECISMKPVVATEFKGGNRVITPYKGLPKNFLSADVSEMLVELQDQLREAQADTEAHKRCEPAEDRTVKQRSERTAAELRRYKDQKRILMRKIQTVQRELRESKEADKEEDTTTLEEELTELREGKATALAKMEDEENDLREKMKYVDSIKEELSVITMREEELKKELEEQMELLKMEMERAHNAEKQLAKLKRDAAADKANVESAEEVFKTQSAKFEETKNVAEEQTREYVRDWDGKPLPLSSRDTKTRLEAQAKAAKKQLEEERARNELSGLTLEIASERYKNAKQAYKDAEDIAITLSDQLDNLKIDLKNRVAAYKLHLASCSGRVDRLFTRYLSAKGFEGSIDFIHPDPDKKSRGRLLMAVSKDATVGDEATQSDVRNLSGGERSFTTLCLLLALGHVVDAPFRVMDEYDVFLDEFSRKVTLNQIVDYTKDINQRSKQFIIITPNNLADIKTGNHCKIVKMANPERRSAVGLQQQTL